MIPKTGYRFSEKIMLNHGGCPGKRPALRLDHRKSDVSDLRKCIHQRGARGRRRMVMANWKSSTGLALTSAMAMVLLGPANAQQDGLVTERNISLNMAKAIAET